MIRGASVCNLKWQHCVHENTVFWESHLWIWCGYWCAGSTNNLLPNDLYKAISSQWSQKKGFLQQIHDEIHWWQNFTLQWNTSSNWYHKKGLKHKWKVLMFRKCNCMRSQSQHGFWHWSMISVKQQITETNYSKWKSRVLTAKEFVQVTWTL